MSSVHGPNSYEVADYAGVLRRRWAIVVGLTVLGVAAAFGYVVTAPKSYSATASVLVTPTGASQSNQIANARTSGPVSLDTEAQIVPSENVASIAVRLMHSSASPSALSKQVSVTVPANTQILQITCKASSPSDAVACANAFATAYLRNRRATANATIASELRVLGSKITSLQQAVGKATRPPVLPNSQRGIQLKALQNELTALYTQQAALTSEQADSSGGYIIDHPSVPTSPSSPRKLLVLPSGLVAGLVLGLICAFWLDRRDKRLHGTRDVERVVDAPVVLRLPGAAFSKDSPLASPGSRTGQAFTDLAHTVAATLGEGNHVILVAGTVSGPGTSVISANLAAALARSYSEAVLVCDLNRTWAPEVLGLPSGPGLAETLVGEAALRDVVCAVGGISGFWAITPGEDVNSANYRLGHDSAHALMQQLRKDVRFVVVELQATSGGADMFVFAEFADAVLIGVEIERTLEPEALEATERLRHLRAPILGAVVSPPISGRFRIRGARPGQARSTAASGKSQPDPLGHLSGDLLNASSVRPGKGDPHRRSRDGRSDPVGRVPRT